MSTREPAVRSSELVAADGRAPRVRGVTRRTLVVRALDTGAGVAALAGVAACSFGPGTPPAPKGPVTISYLSGLPETNPEGAARLFVLDEFNKTNALQITVDLNDGKAATGTDKVMTLGAAGTPPDLYITAYSDAVFLYVAGLTIDVDSELKAEKDWAKQRADIFPAMLESSLWRGKLVGIPAYTNNTAIIYNKSLLPQFGVSLPQTGWTWNDFREMTLKMQRPPLVTWAFTWQWKRWTEFLGTTGARTVSKDARTITLDTPEALAALEYLLGLVKAGVCPPNGQAELYRQGKIAFENQGPFRLPTLRQVQAPDFGVIHTPVHPVKKQVFAQNFGHNVYVFQTAPEKRRAAALVAKYLNAPHAQAQMCIRATSIPVSKGAMESRELQDYLKTDEQFKGFVDLAPYGWRWPALPSATKVDDMVRNPSPVMKQEMGIRAWLSETQRTAQVLLDADVALMK